MVMKRFLISLVSIFCLTCWASNAQASFFLGARAGYTAAWIPGTICELGGQVLPHSSFYAGITGDCIIGEMFLMSFGAEYCGKGYNTKLTLTPNAHERQRIDMNYVEFPLLFGVSLAENRINLSLGPEFDVLCTAKATYETPLPGSYKDKDVRELCSKFDVGIAAQINYMIIESLGLDIRFCWGMNKTFLGKIYTMANEHGHNLSAQIGICYKFGF